MNITTFFRTFTKLLRFNLFSKDFSWPGNNHLKIPGLFQVLHDRTNPGVEQLFSGERHTLFGRDSHDIDCILKVGCRSRDESCFYSRLSPPSTHESGEVVVDAVRRQSLAELGFLPQELVLHLGQLLLRAGLVVASHGGERRPLELPLGMEEQLLVHFLGRNYLTWDTSGSE